MAVRISVVGRVTVSDRRSIKSSITRSLAFVDFAPVSDAHDEDENELVFYGADEPVIAYAIFPELAEFGSVQRISDTSRILERGHPLVEKLQNAVGDLRIKSVELPVDLRG
jgi:hypothetical protein